MPGTILVQREDNHQVRFQYNWQAHSTTTITDSTVDFTPWQSIDISFKEVSKSPEFLWPENVQDTHLLIELSAGGYRRIYSSVPICARMPLSFCR
ncbi:hypothetical protein F5Y00DRAFT_227365 [Daldinia vernicosa]|uniref:uncharacterized protein n=1 Tax=Daldinia vernicosa TaxID=114800 RepID=UPI002008A99B|nr:uncharacterized protein F5Y00DRAFT_227365 [Daldinia vernicosa]KAI0852705.1 hypothetical protein F5Y00DRAFT_227365 [Daldinia vernicosa]